MEIIKYLRNKSWIFWSYLSSLILIAILPLNGSSEMALNNVFIIHLRLDHLLHGLLFLPWIFIGITCKQMETRILIVTGLLAAILLESIQFFLPYRSFSINDMISNVLGLITGLPALYLNHFIKKSSFQE
jgi:glycopeptide antibiotics resistance protein